MSEQNSKFPIHPAVALVISGLFLSSVIYSIYQKEHSVIGTETMATAMSMANPVEIHAEGMEILRELEEGAFGDFDADEIDEMTEIVADIEEAHVVADQLKATGVDSLVQLGSKLDESLAEFQAMEFPVLRRLFLAYLTDEIDDESVSVAVWGEASDKFEMITPEVTSKETAEKVNATLSKSLEMFRFKEATFKASAGEEIAHFAIPSKADRD